MIILIGLIIIAISIEAAHKKELKLEESRKKEEPKSKGGVTIDICTYETLLGDGLESCPPGTNWLADKRREHREQLIPKQQKFYIYKLEEQDV